MPGLTFRDAIQHVGAFHDKFMVRHSSLRGMTWKSVSSRDCRVVRIGSDGDSTQAFHERVREGVPHRVDPHVGHDCPLMPPQSFESEENTSEALPREREPLPGGILDERPILEENESESLRIELDSKAILNGRASRISTNEKSDRSYHEEKLGRGARDSL